MIGLDSISTPGPPGSLADELRVRSIATVAERARRILQLASDDDTGVCRRCFAAADEMLAGCAPHVLRAAFDSPLAYFDAPPEMPPDDGIADIRSLQERALSLLRFCVGVPGSTDCLLMLPPEAFPEDGLYLPHLHAAVYTDGGPVAVHTLDLAVRITWSDGVSATLPVGGFCGAMLPTHPRLRFGQHVGGVPVLNECPWLRRSTQSFDQADPKDAPGAWSTFQEGLNLLDAVWPAAFAGAERFLHGVLFLRSRDHVRSHTSSRLQGAVATTVDSSVQVADTLCHELSHGRMNLLREIEPLLLDGTDAVHPSPWRQDLRPMIGILDGVHAFLNVCIFYRRLHALPEYRAIASTIFVRQAEKLQRGWEYLRMHSRPTETGEALLSVFEREVRDLCT